ncbi:hypothetical protein VTK73DRAFT_1859 [Phialemonium thermophilum]|uniref:WHIM1 domain-containing protein n=1 Tax=Phialemonium thermophilum TaxID=223376 RepID=A0ABR3X707_9PEZI
MAAADESSELSSLSSLSEPPSSEDESDIVLERQNGILKFFHKVDRNPELETREPTPPRPKREPSPPHEYVLADNPDIAFIVMFRARFTEVLPKSLANFGPQELERDVVETVPGERVEHFLCALLGLLLNRKQDVKPGHYNRALEEAIQTHKAQWAKDWESKNPLAGGATFGSMTPVQRLTLLRTLILWTLSSSDTVKAFVNKHYKTRHEDDLNVSISVQPWGSDGDKRRYFLIEGNDDTAFRVYRESNPARVHRTWWSVAGTIDELKALADKLETTDGGSKAKALAKRIRNSIPRFEATEEKRRRREYRQMRKQQFKRPEPGFSLYEGRTRGKRIKYTYSDDEDDFLTDSTNRRSTRNTRNHTPAEPAGPVVTASGRQVRAPTRLNVDTPSVDAGRSVSGSVHDGAPPEDVEMEEGSSIGPTGRPRRSAAVHHGMNGWASRTRKSEEYESDEDDEGSEPDFGDDEEEDEHVPEDEEEDEEEFEEDDVMEDDLPEEVQPRLVVKLPIKAAVDGDGKAKLVDAAAEQPAEESAQTVQPQHRNTAVSDEPDATDGRDVPGQAPPAENERPEDVISAAAGAKEAQEGRPDPVAPPPPAAVATPLTPTSGPPSSLAFRGSPEKVEQIPQPIDVGGGE